MLSSGFVSRAAWSPDGAYLAFVSSLRHDKRWDYTLYLAQGDGAKVHQIAKVESCEHGQLLWASDSESMILVTDYATYNLDVRHEQIQSLLTPDGSPPLVSQPTDICGDVSNFLVRGHPVLGEITAACWSPDGALLAVGAPDALSIYDAQLHLLFIFRVDGGAVRGIAWSPVP